MESKRVFVTVGTTKFEKLIETMSDKEILNILQKLGYTSVQYQTGTGFYQTSAHEILKLTYNTYFDHFETEIYNSDLIISHAGAGTCLEVLAREKKLIVVINEDLMDNHQLELATQLQNDGYLYYCTCATLKDTLLNKDLNNLKPYPKPNKTKFSDYVDKCMGFTM